MLLTIKFFTRVTKPPEEIVSTLFLFWSISLCFPAVNEIWWNSKGGPHFLQCQCVQINPNLFCLIFKHWQKNDFKTLLFLGWVSAVVLSCCLVVSDLVQSHSVYNVNSHHSNLLWPYAGNHYQKPVRLVIFCAAYGAEWLFSLVYLDTTYLTTLIFSMLKNRLANWG